MSIGIIGAGPVGLMLALFLDRRGVASTVYERESQTNALPRGSTHSARTMEHYRRLGLARQIERLGLPAGHSAGIAFRRAFNGTLLADVDWPNAFDPAGNWRHGQPNDAHTPERMLRANQCRVEPFLLAEARGRACVDVKTQTEVLEIRDLGTAVELSYADSAGVEHRARHSYVVGCDGSKSLVRKQIGARLEGDAALPRGVLGAESVAAHLRIRGLGGQGRDNARRWSSWVFDDDLAFNLIALDGRDEYSLLTGHLDRHAGPADVQWLVQDNTNGPLDVDVLSMRRWDGGVALVCDEFSAGRIFIAGDAAHLFTPHGGFGMNTGVDEVTNLAWKLAAVEQSWAHPDLLASYTRERRSTALANTAAARTLGGRLAKIARTGTGLGLSLETYATATMDTDHISLGANYQDSPITTQGAPGGSSSLGRRLPHRWLGAERTAGDSLYDRLGWGFTFLGFARSGLDKANDALAMAAARQVPMSALCLDDDSLRDEIGADFGLVRPDGHLCWTGNDLDRSGFGQAVVTATGYTLSHLARG